MNIYLTIKNTQKMKNSKLILGLILISILVVSCCDCPQGNPENEISASEANTLEENFINFQANYINNDLVVEFPEAVPDSRAVYFQDIEDVQKFLQKVKLKAEKEKKDNVGIYVNFGARVDSNGENPRSTVYLEGVYVEDASLPEGATGMIVQDPEPKSLELFYNRGMPKKPGKVGDN